MTIEEKMARKEAQDQIEIGEIAEGIAQGNAGTLMKCLIEELKLEMLERADNDSNISSDRALGFILAYAKLQDRLDQCVSIKNQLIAEKKEESKVKSS